MGGWLPSVVPRGTIYKNGRRDMKVKTKLRLWFRHNVEILELVFPYLLYIGVGCTLVFIGVLLNA
tara:strand:- start:339 stop:533 length:195 start_codon:yes stop_codon:yes gene_type:complete